MAEQGSGRPKSCNDVTDKAKNKFEDMMPDTIKQLPRLKCFTGCCYYLGVFVAFTVLLGMSIQSNMAGTAVNLIKNPSCLFAPEMSTPLSPFQPQRICVYDHTREGYRADASAIAFLLRRTIESLRLCNHCAVRYISLEPDSNKCEEVKTTVASSYGLDANGYWSTSTKYNVLNVRTEMRYFLMISATIRFSPV